MKFRKIIHIDMDAFYASVEQLDFPELRGKPVAVGGNYERGVLSTASYEARKFGVRAAMSSKLALKKCPDLIFVPPRFYRYQEISFAIHEIFKRYTDVIEPLSLDEAYLDVTYNKLNLSSATFIAQAIKNDIRNELQLVASAGISYNKFLAKVASDQDKPDGLFVITPTNAQKFIDELPISNFYGVGRVTAEKLKDLGVTCGKDLRQLSLEFITNHFGKLGFFLYNVARGIDERLVKSEHVRKSIAVENTFEVDIEDLVSFNLEANKIVEKLWLRYQKHGVSAKTLSIKIKYSDFKIISRSISAPDQLIKKEDFIGLTKKLFRMIWPFEKPVRLIGYQLSNFVNEEEVVEEKIETQKPTQLTLDF